MRRAREYRTGGLVSRAHYLGCVTEMSLAREELHIKRIVITRFRVTNAGAERQERRKKKKKNYFSNTSSIHAADLRNASESYPDGRKCSGRCSAESRTNVCVCVPRDNNQFVRVCRVHVYALVYICIYIYT